MQPNQNLAIVITATAKIDHIDIDQGSSNAYTVSSGPTATDPGLSWKMTLSSFQNVTGTGTLTVKAYGQDGKELTDAQLVISIKVAN